MALKELAPVHIQIMDYILANPDKNYGDVAAHFGYTPGWLSQIIHADAFQALLAEKQVDLFSDVRLTIKDRVTGLAHESLKRLVEKLPTEQDTDKVANVADIALKALGFGGKAATPAGAGITINGGNVIVSPVDAGTLAEARQLMHRAAPALPATLPKDSSEPEVVSTQ
jgi:hypothetical protein